MKVRPAVAAAICCAGVLAGCTAPTPEPTPSRSVGSTVSGSPVATDALVCEPLSPAASVWVEAAGGPIVASATTMIKVGQGDFFGEEWWVVAERGTTDANGTPGQAVVNSWLTNMDSAVKASGTQWIFIGDGKWSWSKVTWTGDRLARGIDAQALAISCLQDNS